MNEDKAEEVQAKRPYKRIAEPITTFLAACWMAAVAIFNIKRPEVITTVGTVITASSYLIGFLVDKSRGA